MNTTNKMKLKRLFLEKKGLELYVKGEIITLIFHGMEVYLMDGAPDI